MRNNNKKLILKTVAITLLIQCFLAGIGGLIVYKNYNAITAAKSGISQNTVKVKPITLKEIEIKEENILDENTLYDGIFGKIEKFNKKEKTDKESIEEIKYIYDFNQDNINKKYLITFLQENKLLDKYILNFINNSDTLNINNELSSIVNFAILLKYIKKDNGNTIIQKFNKYIENKNTEFTENIDNDNFDIIATNLLALDTDITDIPENIYGNIGIIKDENFQYIISKLYKGDYIRTIKKVASETDVDYKLIFSSIAVEQLRYLTTDRGYAKRLIKQNKFLTTFTQFSYGLGGIKTHTFENINYWLYTYDRNLYNRLYKIYDKKSLREVVIAPELGTYSGEAKVVVETEDKGKYDDDKIKEILENEYSGILYVAGLVYSIQSKRKIAGYDISNKPGVITTLYNMGNNKIPHGNPDLGGSLIKINDDNTLYFGEIGLIFNNYIKYYLEK